MLLCGTNPPVGSCDIGPGPFHSSEVTTRVDGRWDSAENADTAPVSGGDFLAKILLIEDQHFIARILTIVLKANEHTVLSARNGEEGLAAWRSENPHLIITDIILPDISGLDVIRRVTSTSLTPVIAITGGSKDLADQARQAGAFTVLLKPVEQGALLDAIQRALQTQSTSAIA